MELEILKELHDIKTSIDEIDGFISDHASYKKFLEDRKTVYAVERKLEIIGECVLRIMRKDPFIQIENARRIVQFRNRIAHEYDRIDYTIMWSILKNHLPLLKQDVLLLLDKLDDPNVR
jgi:uncharacterized protein with HEPN domain